MLHQSLRIIGSIIIMLVCIAEAYRCINFYGLETTQAIPVCSWKHEPGWYLDRLKTSMGIDSVRVPFSYEYVSCQNDSMDGLRNLVRACGDRNLSVILDYHRGYADHQGPSPIEKEITYDRWAELWFTVLDDMVSAKHVKALSLFNEYQGSNKTDAESLQLKLAGAIENIYPDRFQFMFGCSDWGTDCRNMFDSLPSQRFADRSYVEIHTYSFHGFNSSLWPAQGKRVFVGEMGWTDNATDWAKTTVSYLKSRRIRDVCLWTIAHSHDTGNVYEDDCETQKTESIDLFNSLYDRPQCLRGNRSY